MRSATSNKIVIVLTNQAFIPHRSRWEEEEQVKQQQIDARDPKAHCKAFTGVDVYELAYLWVTLTKKANVQIDFASPWGGAVPSDPDSLNRLMKDENLLKEIRSINDFITLMDHTYPINAIQPQEYKAAVVIGSYGAMFDLPRCTKVQQVLLEIYESSGFLCTIGHGAAVLANIRESSQKSPNAKYLIKDKKIACPTNREEKEKRLERFLPFLVEDRLKERGARIEEAQPFKPNVVVDERLITAQNAASIKEFVRKISEKAFNKPLPE